MPHATGDDTMDEAEAIRRYLDGGGPEGGAGDFLNREIDQRDKAENAIDFEDISDDDDLPDEEEATQNLDGEDDLNTSGGHGVNGFSAPAHDHTNGYHEKEPHSDELFGGEEVNDLFGERFSSPEQERQPAHRVQAQPPLQQRSSGLALPSKSGLALPGFAGTYRQAPQVQAPRPQPSQYSPSLSPPSFRGDHLSQMSPSSMPDSEDEDDGETDPMVLQQRKLLQMAHKKHTGQEVEEERDDVDMADFWALFPAYDKDTNPRFIEYFPQRPVKYRGKVPAKPPKPVQPTKLSLDLLPDQERAFKSLGAANKAGQDAGYGANLVLLAQGSTGDSESGDDDAWSRADDEELVGGMTMQDLALVCEDWDTLSVEDGRTPSSEKLLDGEWEAEERARPSKKQKTDVLDADLSLSTPDARLAFAEPERAVARVAKTVTLDMNDPNLLIDEQAPQNVRKTKRMPGDIRRDTALARDLAKRYNISNDEAYDLLKENHQHKVRSTLGNSSIEHSLPATKLQFPFYKVNLETKARRAFHRPALDLRETKLREYRFNKLKNIKRKERKGRDIKDLFSTSATLALDDNSSMLLLEYSEEAPLMLSNFGMGNKLVNYYRKKNADDQERPKRDIGDLQVLLTQDKSPFNNFGHVDQGEVVPTIQNTLYKAPVFQHKPQNTDFLLGISTTHEYGSRMYLRNLENLHTVGQQFPVSEVPGEHSRKVTDAAKKRLRALAYRIYTKAQDPTRRDKQLDNASLMPHLKGHDMPQTRSKMREFMKYERMPNKEGGVWVPLPGQVVPDAETLRSWVKPEDVCLLDSMQVGVQHLQDLGLSTGKDADEDKDIDENANIEQQLAPWRATKNFLHATQGKAMLKLHGEGDPTGRGEGFSFVKTSMKGGFQALGESVEDKIDARKRRENGGHSYNVAKQQRAYDEYIRRIWEKQKDSLTSDAVISDTELDEEDDIEAESAHPSGRAATPRSSFAGTPAGLGRRDDETGTQISKASDRGNERVLLITRTGGKDAYGRDEDNIEKITNPRVIREYKKRRNERRLGNIDIMKYEPDGKDPELDKLVEIKVREEVARVERNRDRREARERAKGGKTGAAGSPSASVAGSPGPSDVDAQTPANGSSVNGTPQKGRGRNKDGTARKCANCGQVGHIKTNRKSVYTLRCPVCGTEEKIYPSNGAERKGKGNGVLRADSAGPFTAATGRSSAAGFHAGLQL